MLGAILSFYFSNIAISQPINIQDTSFHPAAGFEQTVSVSPLPQKIQEGNPTVQASSALVVDIGSGKVLWGKETETRRQIASITKLMTAIIVLEENSPNDIVTISRNASLIEGSRIWLAPGDKLTVQDLVAAMLIHSANDAAYALAENNANGSIENFVKKMNKKAQELGLKNTHFANPMGFDGTENYSTAQDIAQLGQYAYRKAIIRNIVATSSTEIKSIQGHSYKLESTNDLLTKDHRFKGLKTGHTSEAGYSFVGVAEGSEGYPVIIIVFNSPNRFQESINLMDWATSHYKW
jgi:D-alanyl-D-alanine carboxypeptidase